MGVKKLIKERVCKYCSKEFFVEGRVFSNHVRWCKKNTDYDDNKFKEKLSNTIRQNNKKEEYIKKCKRCGKKYTVICKEKHLNNKKYAKQFCSRTCANTRVLSENTKNKIKLSINKFNKENPKVKTIKGYCLNCNKEIYKGDKKCCSLECRKTYRRKDLDKYRLYWLDCQFKFNLKDYPNEYDFSLIEKYGWYKAKNNGDNLNGVSRDHIISIKYGFENGIDSNIISHPANCQLLRHNDNISKYCKCDLTVKELLQKINKWNLEYKF